MADIKFLFLAKSQKGGLYKYNYTDTETNKKFAVYFVQTSVPANSDPISLTSAWNDLQGAFLFLPYDASISDQTTFIDDFLTLVDTGGGNAKWLGWVNDPAKIKEAFPNGQNLIKATKAQPTKPYHTYQVTQGNHDNFVSFGNLGMIIPNSGTLVISGSDPLGITMKKNTGQQGTNFFLKWNSPTSNATQIEVDDNGVKLPLTGNLSGTFQFNILPDRGSFYTLFVESESFSASPSAEMRYTYGSADAVTTIRYPIFQGVISNTNKKSNKISLQASIDPLRPIDGVRTFFNIKPTDGLDALSCEFFMDTGGKTLTLKPTDTGGFGLGLRPKNAGNTGDSELYLLPNGKYQVNGASANPVKIQAMCGIIGTEFLLIAEGDYIEFGNRYIPLSGGSSVPDVGHAPNFPAGSAPAGQAVDLLDGKSTTGWLKVIPGPNQEKVFGKNAVFTESYCVQSLGAVFFQESGDNYYSVAIGCRLADLSTDKQKPFPMVPYAGVYASTANFDSPNPNVTGETFEDFELEVISPNRRRQMQPDECLGPLFFDMSNNVPLDKGFVRTANGMIVKLNDGKIKTQPAGTWNELLLAKSPVNDSQYLSVGIDDVSCDPKSFEVVNPQLSNSIMDNSPFIVITQDKWGTHKGVSSFVNNELQMGEFTFQLDLKRNASQNSVEDYTVIIFKLGKGKSVLDLSTSTSRWTNPDYFVGDDKAVGKLSTQLESYINAAKTTDQESIFYDFYTKMTNKEWTGVIALNCSLDYSALPIDLQMLLGGIDGQLMAHHFGITVNHITKESDTSPIDNSSLFGLVHYSKELDTQSIAAAPHSNHFQVLKLNALFKNSALSHFDSKIAMTIPMLFAENTKLTTNSSSSTYNIIEINGVYQKPDDPNKKVGKVVFESEKLFVFDFTNDTSQFRVLDKMVAIDAALSPVRKDENGDGSSTIISHFSLGGGLGFVDSIGRDPNNPDHSSTDLFSFGISADYSTGKKGLGVTDYNLEMTTKITTDNTATLNPDIPTRYDEIRMFIQQEDQTDQSRTGSFFDTFPLKFIDFVFNTSNGLSAGDLKGRQMIMDKFGASEYSGLLKDVSPNFGLKLKINVGSLGGLVSDKSTLEAEVVMGWTVAGNDSTANKVGMIFIPPKGISADGSFKIQGVFNAFYGDILLDRYPKTDGSSDLLFVITLKDVNFYILSIPLIPATWERALTFFGDPTKPKGNNLSWFVGNPSHDPTPDTGNGTVDVSFIAKPFMGLMSGLDLKTDPTTINVIGPTINSLFGVPISTMKIINNIASGETGSVVNYNPDAGLLFWLEIDFAPISLKLLFDDPSLYGGVIKVGPPKKKKQEPDGDDGGGGGGEALADDEGGGGDDGKKGLADTWGGLELVFVYRKINDNLGEYAGQFTLPKAISTFNLGEVEITLPSFGMEYFTNGDFKVTVGWPFSSTTSYAPGAQQLKIIVVILGVPVEFVAGFYLAKLRSEDAPAEFGNEFGLIWMFGIGLGGGLGFQESLGPASLSVSVLLWVTLEAMLGSKSGDITKNGVDYYWFAGQVGLTANITGKVDFKIISASLEIEATLVVTLAVETGHRTEVRAAAQLKIEVKVHVVFFTISFRFKADVTIGKFDFGPKTCEDGSPAPIAQVSAPTVPQACGYKPTSPRAMMDTSTIEEAMVEPTEELGFAETAAPEPVNLTIYFAVQPTAAWDTNAFKPFGVASLFIQSASGADFTKMTKGIGNWMFAQYKGTATDFPTQIKNVLKQLDTFESNIMTALSQSFTFTIEPRTKLGDNPTLAVFPIIPGLDAVYDGGVTMDFDEHQATGSYLQVIENYYNHLSHIQSAKPGLATAATSSITQYVFENYFGMVGKGLFEAILKMTEADNGPATMDAAYAKLSAADSADGTGFENISGMVSRFMLHGLQLPDPSDSNTLKPLYSLTNQQTELTEKKSVYNKTFELKQGSAPSWVKLSTAPLTDVMDDKLILKDVTSINTDWTSNAKALNPLLNFTRTFNFNNSISWTDSGGTEHNIRSFPDGLSQMIAIEGSSLTTNNLVAKELPGSSGESNDVTQLKTVDTLAALFIKFKLKQIPDPNNPGKFFTGVFQVEGTDEATRKQIQDLLADGTASIGKISLLTSAVKGSYTSAKHESKALLARTNLSTDAVPAGTSFADFAENDSLSSDSALGPIQAMLTVAEAKDFLRLIWEVSIVHTKGFFLMVEGLETKLFKNQEASVALMVQLGTTAASAQNVKSYHNMIVVDKSQKDKAVGAYLQDEHKNTLKTYRSNYLAGYTGFSIDSQTPAVPSVTDAGAYLESIYHFIQYKVDSISGDSGFTPSNNWSLPLGAKSEPDPTDSSKLNWTFRQSIPVPQITGATNRYSAIGRTVNVTARVLDMFGNAHPKTWQQSLEVKYNDPLVAPAQWQGVHSSYKITGDSGHPQLNLQLDYDDNGIKKSDKGTDNAPSQLQQAITKYKLIYDQLTDPNVTASIETTLSGTSAEKGVENTPFKEQLSAFVKLILDYLQNTGKPIPAPIVLKVNLDPAFIKGLKDDIIEVDVNLTISRDKSKVDSSISDLFSEVLATTNLVPPYVSATTDTGDKPMSGLIPFAQGFEKAYAGFGGADTQLKVAQGPKKPSATGGTTRQVFAIRWGKSAGINVDAPNSGNSPTIKEKPDYFAPAPLSTVLINDTFDGLYTYDPTTGKPTNTKVKKTFNNVDMDIWARYFLNNFHGLMSPEMSTAIAELDELDTSGNSSNFEQLIKAKQSLADYITENVTNIIDFSGVTPDPTEAKAVFKQALLVTLTEDYGTSVIVQLPADVSVKGNTPSIPPRLYGKISTNKPPVSEKEKNYTISNGSLKAENASEQFAFLMDSKRPESDAFLEFDNLFFDIGFVEYKFDKDASDYGFIPSSWLTFVIPKDEALQIPLGKINAPIPLRAYPPAPILVSSIMVKPENPPTNITDSLNWDYQLTVGKPVAEQDQLVLTLTFNEPLEQTVDADLVGMVETSGRPAPKSLSEALARFIFEYPQLAPSLPAVIKAASGTDTTGQTNARAIIADIVEMVYGICGTWHSWENPGKSTIQKHNDLHGEEPLGSIYDWNYSIINKISNNSLLITRGANTAPWPEIKGYSKGSVEGNTMTYNGSDSSGNQLQLTFKDLFILTHQSVNVSAFVVRNEDLGIDGGTTNKAFVYTTEPVKFPTPLVPLNENDQPISYSGSGLTDTLTNLFDLFFIDPKDQNNKVSEVKFSLSIETKFPLASNNSNNVISARTPVLFSSEQVMKTGAVAPAIELSDYISNLVSGIPKPKPNQQYFLVMTIFANISSGQLPLVIYSEIDLKSG